MGLDDWLEGARKRGYQVHVVYVGLPWQEGARRALKRYFEKGQGFIPWSFIEPLTPQVTYGNLQQKKEPYESYTEFNNDVPAGEPPRLVRTSNPEALRLVGIGTESGGALRGGSGQGGSGERGGSGPATEGGLSDEPPGEPEPPAASEPPGPKEPVRPGGQAGPGGTARPGGRTPGRPTGRGPVSAEPERPADNEPAPEVTSSPPPPAVPANVGNFTITDLDYLSTGGAKTKFNANRDALRVLRAIQAEGRQHATREEQEKLARWTGWGQFPQVFDEANQDWTQERAALRGLLPTDAEWESAKRTTLNAHYTDPRVAAAMWRMVERLGFPRGRVLEAGLGSGIFFGTMPAALRDHAALTGVELDPVTGAIAQLLYPAANVQVKGFQDFAAPDGFYDLNIGNYPFADITIHSDRTYRKLAPVLHDYFLLKALDKVHPGGLAVVITSTGTLDKMDARIRQAVDAKAELVAAYRLPGGAFQKNAGTQVVTDLLVFRRWLPDELN